MTRNRVIIVVVLLAVFVLGSLARNSLAGPDNPVQPNVGIEPPWLPTDGVPELTPAPDTSVLAVQAAIAAFALELEVATETIRVLAIEPKDWPSSALGCPKPGENYLPVITPGFVIRLEADEEAEYATATYHTSDGSVGPLRVVRCDEPGGTPRAEEDRSLPAVEAAIKAFALELEVAPETIRVVSVEPRDWPSSALGCPKPGENYLPVITPGYAVMLEAGAEAEFATATYHTSDGSVGPVRVVRCDRL